MYSWFAIVHLKGKEWFTFDLPVGFIVVESMELDSRKTKAFLEKQAHWLPIQYGFYDQLCDELTVASPHQTI